MHGAMRGLTWRVCMVQVVVLGEGGEVRWEPGPDREVQVRARARVTWCAHGAGGRAQLGRAAQMAGASPCMQEGGCQSRQAGTHVLGRCCSLDAFCCFGMDEEVTGLD